VIEAPAWIDKRALLLLHQENLAQFGGTVGLRDEGALDAALARPINKFRDDGCKSPAALASAYASGLVRDQPFVDGNKRAALMAVGVFLAINGYRLAAKRIEAIEAIMAFAAGDLEEARFADWIETCLLAKA